LKKRLINQLKSTIDYLRLTTPFFIERKTINKD